MFIVNILILLHFGFILFVVFGGLLVLKWPRLAWGHIPAVIWGVIVEGGGLICPLTPMENHYLTQTGHGGYEGDFIVHHLLPVIYPEGLTQELQLVLAGIVVIINSVIYLYIFRKEVEHDSTDRQ